MLLAWLDVAIEIGYLGTIAFRLSPLDQQHGYCPMAWHG